MTAIWGLGVSVCGSPVTPHTGLGMRIQLDVGSDVKLEKRPPEPEGPLTVPSASQCRYLVVTKGESLPCVAPWF